MPRLSVPTLMFSAILTSILLRAEVYMNMASNCFTAYNNQQSRVVYKILTIPLALVMLGVVCLFLVTSALLSL